MQVEGYIYILFNPAFRANQFKIGMTTRTPEERALEISAATGVPQPFEVMYKKRVTDCNKAERLIHARLAARRGSTNREFFDLPLADAIQVMNDIAVEVGVLDVDTPVVEDDTPVASAPVSGDIGFTRHPKIAGRSRKAKTPGIPTTFEDHASFADIVRQPILRQLRQDILTMDDRLAAGETITPAQRIVYKIPGGKNFIEVKVQKSAVLVRLIETRVVDPRLAVREIPISHGWGDLKDEIRITSASELEYVLPSVRAAYQIAAGR